MFKHPFVQCECLSDVSRGFNYAQHMRGIYDVQSLNAYVEVNPATMRGQERVIVKGDGFKTVTSYYSGCLDLVCLHSLNDFHSCLAIDSDYSPSSEDPAFILRS